MPKGRIGAGGPFLVPQKQADTAVALDENEGWDNLAAIPIALAAATLSTAVAAASSFNQYTEEIVPYKGSDSSFSAPAGQRAQHKPLFIRWDQNDELPVVVTFPAFDEDGWTPPVTLAAKIPQPVFESEELPVATVFEDEGQPQTVVAARLAVETARLDDDLPQAPVAGIVEESEQVQYQCPPVSIGSGPPTDEELPSAPVTGTLEESDWVANFYAKTLITQPWIVEEEFPTLSTPSTRPQVGGSWPQRARHSTVFIRWQQTEEWPTPAVLAVADEVDGPIFTPKIREAEGIFWATDEDIVPFQAVVIDEVYWQAYVPVIPAARWIYIPEPEEVPTGNFSAIASEEYHYPVPPQIQKPFAPVSEYDDVIVPQPAPLNVDELYDILPMVTVPVPQPVAVIFGGDEEMGDFVAPPVVVEVRDLGAKWPVRVTEYLTKIKDRFYWFRDESELPKEESKPKPLLKVAQIEKTEITPAISEQAKVQSAADVAKRKRIEETNEAIMKLFL